MRLTCFEHGALQIGREERRPNEPAPYRRGQHFRDILLRDVRFDRLCARWQAPGHDTVLRWRGCRPRLPNACAVGMGADEAQLPPRG